MVHWLYNGESASSAQDGGVGAARISVSSQTSIQTSHAQKELLSAALEDLLAVGYLSSAAG